MKKTELLVPAGNMETLIVAVNNGADAVYVGGKTFGARAFAPNFNDEEMVTAIEYCHLCGVKIYVTVNVVVFENEIETCLNYIKFLYQNGVDAVIMQDLGMISLVRRLLPDLEVHASTQVNCHNDECLQFFKSIGVKRVVLSREMSLDEISKLQTDIEKEIFIHGALCVCYSGQCLFSSLNGGRSGNRGRCTGSCRLPYELYDEKKIETDGNFLLSTKELCTANRIKDILDNNIASLKIEGRMKGPQYVGYVTKVYRRLIDEYYVNGNPRVTREEMINLTKLFNRKFTDGYLFNDDIYNIKSSNHLGYPLGKVFKFNSKKIFLRLSDDLFQGDGIRFMSSKKGMIINFLYNCDGLLTSHVGKGEIAIIDNKIGLNILDNVNKTIDSNIKVNDSLAKKIPLSFTVTALCGDNLKLVVSDGVNKITKTGVLLEKAKKNSTSKKEIIDKLNKLGSTPFSFKNADVYVDGAFVPMSIFNNLRHSAINELVIKRSKIHREADFSYIKKCINGKCDGYSFLVRNEKQLISVLNKGRIYTEDFALYKKYKNKNVFYKLPRIMSYFPDFKGENLLISELGGIYKYCSNNVVIADYPINITNSETVNFLHSLGVKISTLSPETEDFSLIEKYSYMTEKIIYGKVDLMILKSFYAEGGYLKNKFGKKYQIIKGKNYVTILHCDNIDLRDKYVGRIIFLNEKEISC